MSKVCQVSGKRTQMGHNVSHSNHKTKKPFLPNLKIHRIWVPSQNRFVKLRITTYGIRLIDKLGYEQAMARGQAKLK